MNQAKPKWKVVVELAVGLVFIGTGALLATRGVDEIGSGNELWGIAQVVLGFLVMWRGFDRTSDAWKAL